MAITAQEAPPIVQSNEDEDICTTNVIKGHAREYQIP